MLYHKIYRMDGNEICLRNCGSGDAEAVLDCFIRTHEETDFLLSYPDEHTFTVREEEDFLAAREKSDREIEILALVNGKAAGTAGIEGIGSVYKVRHRADFGIAILKEYWGMGIGRLLTEACIACAKEAGYTQLELTAAAENERAIGLYRKLGFTEYGRNPKGFHSRRSGDQELVLMRLELED